MFGYSKRLACKKTTLSRPKTSLFKSIASSTRPASGLSKYETLQFLKSTPEGNIQSPQQDLKMSNIWKHSTIQDIQNITPPSLHSNADVYNILQFSKKSKSTGDNKEDSGKKDEKSEEKKDSDKINDVTDPAKEKKDKNNDDQVSKSENSSKSPSSSSPSGAAASSSAPAGSGDGGSGNDDDGSSVSFATLKPKSNKTSTMVELPEVYPQIVALPISRRPLFPGFYKAVIISDVNVIKAIKESLDKKYPFIGCFLFKDENMESDVIESKDQVFETGVLAQITSNVYTKDKDTGVETLTTVLYPHKRIRIDDLFPPSKEALDSSVSKATISDVDSEETLVDSKAKKQIIEGITGEKEGDEPAETKNKELLEPSDLVNQKQNEVVEHEEEEDNPTAFLKKYPITLANVSNVEDETFEKVILLSLL